MGKLFVTIPQLTPGQRAEIRETASARGYETRFFNTAAEALPEIDEAEIIFGNAPELAGAAGNLRWLCTSTAGANQFMAPGAFASPNAVLTNSAGAYGVTISEHILMQTLELMRRELDYRPAFMRREWKQGLPVRSIYGSRVTLLGTGDIGQETARRLRGFRPACIVGVNRRGGNPGGLFDRTLKLEAVGEVLPETDLLILSLPGTPETFHVLDAERLALLPDGSFIVNVGRGSAIDEAALAAELRSGRLCAALDVFEREPLPKDDPLWDCPNLLITAHVAGNMTLAHTQERIVQLFLEDFARYCDGEPLARRVDMAHGY